ncbi:hypothetical protein Poli38472_005085 [Pythium oligandrum]|uniref:Uncharacterized protein n=1 Tax=Pythium oligandrum TaxID=41045 RepID=A0A8K1CFP6_PYTOL|nr:hypothetical protein Poli38472_005085 [Pythium oligandrum]|eukprot:TMW62467.1 hypothetical protein Poli38472_005085 [Pythium oligandrum]
MTEHRVALAIDLDHTLGQLLPAVVDWHNASAKTAVKEEQLKTADWIKHLGIADADVEEKLLEFYHSEQFTSNVATVDGAKDVLKPLRKYFSLFVVTDRPRVVEKATREWLDTNFSGVFDKLLFLDEDSKDDIVSRKKEIYDEFKVKIAIGSDPAILVKTTEDIDHSIKVGTVPWAAKEGTGKAVVVSDWAAAKPVLEKIIQDLGLKPSDKVSNGPKLSRYTDDLVTVSTKKPASFYASMINSKFVVQKQEVIRLQAAEGAITTAVQAAEMLKLQKHAAVTKISTRYVFKKMRGEPGHRVPKIEIILHKTAATA